MSRPGGRLIRPLFLTVVALTVFGDPTDGGAVRARVPAASTAGADPAPRTAPRSIGGTGSQRTAVHLPMTFVGIGLSSLSPAPTTAPTVAASPSVTIVPTATATATVHPTPTAAPTLAGDHSVDLTHLPFGDAHILRRDKGQTQPAVGSLWLCGVPAQGRGASEAGDWTNGDGTWDFTKKPTVDGRIPWDSDFRVTLAGDGKRLVAGNALPSFLTGVFPIDPASLAYRYDRNPSHIGAHAVDLAFQAMPEVAPSPNCVPYGATGISLTGNAIYHGASTLGTDAAAHEMLDRCGGQSDGSLTYHTHFLTPCLLDALDPPAPGHSALMGYIMDGFGIYGPRGEDGTILASKDLDACHGHAHPVAWDGTKVNLYHYHWTYDFPYNVGCFKGKPIKAWN